MNPRHGDNFPGVPRDSKKRKPRARLDPVGYTASAPDELKQLNGQRFDIDRLGELGLRLRFGAGNKIFDVVGFGFHGEPLRP
jgi:hypothetical protein